MKKALLCLAVLVLLVCVSGRVKKDHVGALNVGLIRSYKLLGAEMPEDDGSVDHYFDQKLDHFNNGANELWKQRYIFNNTYFKKDGPVFLLLGGEGPISPAYIADHFITAKYSQLFGGMVVALEHRFYGKSVPGNDSSTPNLRFLSSEQALADAATFRQYFARKYNTGNSKWIVVGGSYSGCLSAWLKEKYPTLFDGSLASSSPVNPKLDFVEYLEVVSNSVGPNCSARFRAANAQVESLLRTNEGRRQLERLFNTCTPIETDKDVATFLEDLASGPSGVVQYNMDNTNYQPFNITVMCEIMDSVADPLRAWAKLNERLSPNACMEVSYAQTVKDMLATGAGRSWTWQTCTEFGFFQTGTSPNQPFSSLITLSYYVEMCADIFGAPYVPNTAWVRTNYGASDIRTSNTFLANGDVDPWHVLGVLHKNPGPLSATVLINGTAHCADLYMPRDLDLPGLTAARSVGLGLLKKWLA